MVEPVPRPVANTVPRPVVEPVEALAETVYKNLGTVGRDLATVPVVDTVSPERRRAQPAC